MIGVNEQHNFNEKIKAAIYCRVSTYEQAQGHLSSLNGQEETLETHCKNMGWEVYKVYKDTKSGKSLDRDEIKQLLNDAEDGKFNVVVATKLDRLSRSIKDFLEFDSRLNALNIDIVITTQSIDTTTPSGKMQRNIMLVFAEFEREIISERTREKLYIQASKGFWGGGHTPLGYDAVNKKLIINEEEARLVNQIFDLYINGLSAAEIAIKLNSKGYKTKPRKSNDIIVTSDYNKDSILRILKNKKYVGVIRLKVSRIKGKKLQNPIIEEFKGLHQGIVNENKFELVQKNLEKAKTNKFQDYEESPLLLLQKITCGQCGALMTTSFAKSKDGTKIYYYKCRNKQKKNAKSCISKDIPANDFEDFISRLVFQIGSSEELFESVFAQFANNKDEELLNKKEQLEELNRNRTRIITENDRLFNFIMQNEELGKLNSTNEKLKELDEKRNIIETQIGNLKEEIDNFQTATISKDEVKELFKSVPELMKELDKKGKRKLIDYLINEIKWNLKTGDKEGEIEITFRGDGSIQKKWVNRVDPSDLISSFHLVWLREQDSNLQPFG